MKRKRGNADRAQKEAGAQSTLMVVIETPRASRNKYKLNPETSRFMLSKVLPEGMMFPYDFGFVPETRAEDGDPLDVLVLTDEATFPGCELAVRPIGVIKSLHTEKGKTRHNDRVIAVAEQSVRYHDIRDISDIEPAVIGQIEQFFVNYQRVRNIEYRVTGREGAKSALRTIAKSRQASRESAA